MKTTVLIGALAVLGAVTAWWVWSPVSGAGYTAAYLRADANRVGAAEAADAAEVAARFQTAFRSLTAPEFVQRVAALYAERLYFNDTLTEKTSKTALVSYFRDIQSRLQHGELTVLDVAGSGDHLYIRWQMDVRFRVAGRSVASESVGVSHIKVNSEGQIIFHQDFWDSAEGLYRHLPVLGAVLAWSG